MEQPSLELKFERNTYRDAETANTVESLPFWDGIRVRMFEQINGRLDIREAPYRSKALNRQDFLKHFRRFTRQPFKQLPLLGKSCPYCRTTLQRVDYNDLENNDDYWDKEKRNKGALEHCPHCVYWRWHYVKTELVGRSGIHDIHEYYSALSKIRQFDTKLPASCLSEVCQHIRRHPNWWHSAAPKRLEKLVADIFKANYHASEVVHIGKPDDGGVDVIFVNSEKEKWLIQVKRRESPKATESVETVRNLLGAMVLEKSCFGLVVSTADHFSYRACHTAERAKLLGYTVRLYDRGMLSRLLDPLLPDRPWFDLVNLQLPSMLPSIAEKIPSGRQLNLFPHS